MKPEPKKTVFITSDQVAELLEFGTKAQFMTRRTDLIRKHGFPPPLPFIRRPMKWRRADVEAWVAAVNRTMPDGSMPIHAADQRKVVMFSHARRVTP